MPHPILITRPQAAAEGFAAQLRERLGQDALILLSPVQKIEMLHPVLPDPADIGAVLITSSQALPALPESYAAKKRPVFCVGSVTTRNALALGYNAQFAGQTAQALKDRVLTDIRQGPVLYARGRHVAYDLANALSSAGLETIEAITYCQVAQGLTPDARTLLHSDTLVVTPLFSARSADIFIRQCPPSACLRVIAISAQVAQTIPTSFRDGLTIAQAPTAQDMVDSIIEAAVAC